MTFAISMRLVIIANGIITRISKDRVKALFTLLRVETFGFDEVSCDFILSYHRVKCFCVISTPTLSAGNQPVGFITLPLSLRITVPSARTLRILAA